MSIGVLGAGERERPLLLRLSEHFQRITISQNLGIAYLLSVIFFAEPKNTLGSLGIS